MLYTIGDAQNYRAAMQKHGRITKLPGGIVFLTREQAQARIDSLGHQAAWSVFGVEGTLADTETIRGDLYLTVERYIVELDVQGES